MAKVIANSGMTVELTGREVALIRQALVYAINNNGEWYAAEDADANEIVWALERGAE
jgi:hypothetical protein